MALAQMEMASVILQVGYFKWTKGQRIFRCSPIHHHFHLGGWSEQQVVVRFWVLAVVCAMLALVTRKNLMDFSTWFLALRSLWMARRPSAAPSIARERIPSVSAASLIRWSSRQ